VYRKPPDARGSALIFVQMFRSGGTTLNRIIDLQYDPLRVFSVNGRYCRWHYKKLTECPRRVLTHMHVFRGHMPFGLHRFLPQPSTYITIQRDPVERIVSGYYTRLNRVYHREHFIMKGMNFEGYLRRLALNNSQTKMIAGLGTTEDFLAGECTEQTLVVAKDNLSRYFTLVGITERFEETLALSQILFGWKIPHYTSFSATRGRPKSPSPEIRAMIEEYNAFDFALYRHAMTLFDQTLEKHAAEMPAALESVRKAQNIFGAELAYYRTASTALKLFTLGNSTLRSLARI